MSISNMQPPTYFKKYQREHRIQTTEENFTKGIKFEQTPLNSGEHKMILNYDMLNDNTVLTPRKGIRVKEVAMPFATPDLYSQLSEDVLLTNTLDAIEEDGVHYRLFIANDCSEDTIGMHHGAAEMFVEDKDINHSYPILNEYGIETRDLYSIGVSYEPDTILEEVLTEENADMFFTVNKLDYNAKFTDSTFYMDSRYRGGICFRTGIHPFKLSVTSLVGDFALYKAKREAVGWRPIEDTKIVLEAGEDYDFLRHTDYYLLPDVEYTFIEDNPYLTVVTSVADAEVSYDDSDEEFITGTKDFIYHIGSINSVFSTIGATIKINPERYFKYIKSAGTRTYTYLLNTLEVFCSRPNITTSVDHTIFNRLIKDPGLTTFRYIINVKDSIECSTSGASIELDIHRYNHKISAAGTNTFTYNSAGDTWKLSNNNVSLSEYGITFKDPNGVLANNDTIKIITTAKNKFLLNDNYVRLEDYGITCTIPAGTSWQDGDVINIKGVLAGTWLDAEDNYIKGTDYGFEILDAEGRLAEGDTLVVTSTLPTGWQYDGAVVDLEEYGVFFEDPEDNLVDADTITITKESPIFSSQLIAGEAVHEVPGSIYYIPANANGNGFPLINKRAAKAVGCFAWNNNYYNFNNHGELIRTRYQVDDPDEGIQRTYYVEALTPKTVNASEAITSGFNMLLDDPYVFEDSFKDGEINLQGIMVYDDSGALIPEPLLNTPYTLRCFYSVPHKSRYKIKWSYREINTSDWIDIKEEEFTFDKEDKVPPELLAPQFSCPIENCVVRVQAFKWDKESTISYSTSVANASVIINSEELEKQLEDAGTYRFSYDGMNWKHLGKIVKLSSYGITYSDITSGLKAGSTLDITIEYKEQYPTSPSNVITMSIIFVSTLSTATANKDLKNYDLSQCTGMVFWKGHIWLYGLTADPTVLFASDINEPTYFPYPNNIDVFDEPILHCAPFNDALLVFTRSTLYKLVLNAEGYWTTSIIQADLNFSEFDMNMVRIVKNMVFFKSGDYYYMVVPKTLSLQNELAIAPVSKNIEKFLDSFVDNVKDLFKTIYKYEGSLSLTAHYNYLNYEDVHNIYTFEVDNGLLINLDLLYNTVDRYWRMYTYESQELYKPLRQDATKQCEFYAPLHGVFDIDGEQVSRLGVQVLEAMEQYNKDFYIPYGSTFVYSEDEWQLDDGAIEEQFEEQHAYKNWTLLDCGYRNITTDHKKRCRELQFKFNNISGVFIRFFTEFILDGERRIGYYKYETSHIVDPEDPNFGLIYIDKTPIENLDLIGSTLLGIDREDINAWTLDVSKFPEVAFWKARLKVSGKGYTPRFKLISRTEENYELIGYSWVYRELYSR